VKKKRLLLRGDPIEKAKEKAEVDLDNKAYIFDIITYRHFVLAFEEFLLIQGNKQQRIFFSHLILLFLYFLFHYFKFFSLIIFKYFIKYWLVHLNLFQDLLDTKIVNFYIIKEPLQNVCIIYFLFLKNKHFYNKKKLKIFKNIFNNVNILKCLHYYFYSIKFLNLFDFFKFSLKFIIKDCLFFINISNLNIHKKKKL
jgi:hypothetical protein